MTLWSTRYDERHFDNKSFKKLRRNGRFPQFFGQSPVRRNDRHHRRFRRRETTLLRLILGLETPDGGEIAGVPARRAAVFQEDRLCPQLTALENVLLTAGRKKEREARDLLARLGLGESLAIPAAELSGGMRRRCALARSLCAESDLLVLDEPFKGLDEANRRAAMDAVRALSGDKTVLLVTHDAAEAEFFGGNRLSVP